ncbi:hypothetical protein PAXINDRAFT_153505 [Paxillus involutus ATCC 200175]|nr:hypothetical protein PAXINDRAFT_153505 [Paxillus involutus ATCC 200175]
MGRRRWLQGSVLLLLLLLLLLLVVPWCWSQDSLRFVGGEGGGVLIINELMKEAGPARGCKALKNGALEWKTVSPSQTPGVHWRAGSMGGTVMKMGEGERERG